jgi:hypothetical protein
MLDNAKVSGGSGRTGSIPDYFEEKTLNMLSKTV